MSSGRDPLPKRSACSASRQVLRSTLTDCVVLSGSDSDSELVPFPLGVAAQPHRPTSTVSVSSGTSSTDSLPRISSLLPAQATIERSRSQPMADLLPVTYACLQQNGPSPSLGGSSVDRVAAWLQNDELAMPPETEPDTGFSYAVHPGWYADGGTKRPRHDTCKLSSASDSDDLGDSAAAVIAPKKRSRFTAEKQQRQKEVGLIRCYQAVHQGANFLLNFAHVLKKEKPHLPENFLRAIVCLAVCPVMPHTGYGWTSVQP